MLSLPGHNGPVPVEFIVDTGFDGDLSLPENLLVRLQSTFLQDRYVMLADGSMSLRSVYRVMLEWDEQTRLVEIVTLENAPLLGIQLMDGKLLQAEMTDGGEVSLENL